MHPAVLQGYFSFSSEISMRSPTHHDTRDHPFVWLGPPDAIKKLLDELEANRQTERAPGRRATLTAPVGT
jgi:hypothetical protein